MLKTAFALLLAIPLFLAGVVAGTGCLVVDVRTDGGPRIVVPVPLLLARAALAFAPGEAARVEVPELAEHHELALRVLDELRDAPDGVLVEVEDGTDHVWIEKRDDRIEIDVHGDDEEVSVSLPLEAAIRALESYDGEVLEISSVLAALARTARTDLVHVKTGDEEVRVWLW